uniref:Uncharacterized protein n=1 Tax=Kalanchoe fedtschenkoi TaxID=63787 RepID=A0A7N0TW07_KALFE
MVADLDKILLRRAEFPGANGAAEHHDRHHQAQNRDLAVPHGALHLASSPRSQNPLNHRRGRRPLLPPPLAID